MTDKAITEEEKNPVEEFHQKQFHDITVYRMHNDVIADFVHYCKKYTDGKYSAGIQLLLSKAKAFDLVSNAEMRIKALEQQVALLVQSKSVEEHSKPATKVKTIGGEQNAKT